MLRQLALTREHKPRELFLSLIEVYVCSVLKYFFFCLRLDKCVRLAAPSIPEHDKWFRKKMDVKQFSTRKAFPLFLYSACLKYPSPSFIFLLCGWQHVEIGSPAGDPVCHPNAGTVPPGVREPRGAAERPVLPVSFRGGGGWVWFQHGEGAMRGHRCRQPTPRSPVPLCWTWWQREVAAEILQPHLPV